MSITDLLDRIPFPPASRAGRPDVSAGDAPERSFQVELPEIERAGIPLPPGVIPPLADPLPADPSPLVTQAAETPAKASPSVSAPFPADPPAARPPLPSWAVVLIGGLALLCLALAAALALAAGGPAEPTVATVSPVPSETPAPAVAPTAIPVSFSADPSPIPVDLITRLEDASEEPLDVELSRLLDTIQHGFGRQSTQLEPTLRSYAYRMASRFEWNPDTFRVAVTAPDPDLAAARGALLERLFEGATAAGRLQVGTGVGPDALTLVSE